MQTKTRMNVYFEPELLKGRGAGAPAPRLQIR
jgi:hypothetical protein